MTDPEGDFEIALLCRWYGWEWEEVETMPFRVYIRALHAGMRIYGTEKLHDISTSNLGFSDRNAVQSVVAEFRAMSEGRNLESREAVEANWDSLRSRFGG